MRYHGRVANQQISPTKDATAGIDYAVSVVARPHPAGAEGVKERLGVGQKPAVERAVVTKHIIRQTRG